MLSLTSYSRSLLMIPCLCAALMSYKSPNLHSPQSMQIFQMFGLLPSTHAHTHVIHNKLIMPATTISVCVCVYVYDNFPLQSSQVVIYQQ